MLNDNFKQKFANIDIPKRYMNINKPSTGYIVLI